MEENYIIDLENVTVRFNMATEKIDNLKEYFVKLVKRQLMFEEFLALKNITLQIRPGVGTGRNKRSRKIHHVKTDQRDSDPI